MSWTEHPAVPADGTELCALAELADPEAREFRFGPPPDDFRLVVVRRGGLLRAYRNLCPHFRLPLNMRSDRFLDRDGDRLLCRQHYAQFEIADGSCVRGPCIGQALTAVPLRVVAGRVCIGGHGGGPPNGD